MKAQEFDPGRPQVLGTLDDIQAVVTHEQTGCKPRTEDDTRNQQGLILRCVTRMQQRLLENANTREVFDAMLEDVLGLTKSEYGFIGEILSDDAGTYLKTHAITNIAWNEETLKLYEENVAKGLEFRNLDNLFGTVITTGRMVIANSPHEDSRSGGLPRGHPPLNSFLGLPFFAGRQLLGMVGIANRPGGYEQELVDALEPFVVSCAGLVKSLRIETEREQAMTAALESEGRSRVILENSIDAIITIDSVGIIQSCNPATCRLFGYDNSELCGSNVSMLMPEPHRGQHDEYLRRYLDTGDAKIIGKGREVQGLRKDGSRIDIDLGVSRVELSGRTLFVGQIRDISHRKQSEEKLVRLNNELSRRVEELHELDKENAQLVDFGRFLQACRTERDMLDVVTCFASRFFEGTSGYFVTFDDDGLSGDAALWGSQGTQTPLISRNDCWAIRRSEAHRVSAQSHHLRCEHLRIENRAESICVPVLNQDGPVGLLNLQSNDEELTSERARHQLKSIADRLGAMLSNIRLRVRLESDAIRDPLTALYNRRHMESYLRRELRLAAAKKNPLSVILVDIDHFKKINDAHGHDVGDEVLIAVATELARSVRTDDMVCRLGGEEFLVVLPTLGSAGAMEMAEELRRRISSLDSASYKNSLPSVSISSGVASYPTDGSTPQELMVKADRALYRAKKAGRNQVCLAAS